MDAAFWSHWCFHYIVFDPIHTAPLAVVGSSNITHPSGLSTFTLMRASTAEHLLRALNNAAHTRTYLLLLVPPGDGAMQVQCAGGSCCVTHLNTLDRGYLGTRSKPGSCQKSRDGYSGSPSERRVPFWFLFQDSFNLAQCKHTEAGESKEDTCSC